MRVALLLPVAITAVVGLTAAAQDRKPHRRILPGIHQASARDRQGYDDVRRADALCMAERQIAYASIDFRGRWVLRLCGDDSRPYGHRRERRDRQAGDCERETRALSNLPLPTTHGLCSVPVPRTGMGNEKESLAPR